jgi:hypothetical protein
MTPLHIEVGGAEEDGARESRGSHAVVVQARETQGSQGRGRRRRAKESVNDACFILLVVENYLVFHGISHIGFDPHTVAATSFRYHAPLGRDRSRRRKCPCLGTILVIVSKQIGPSDAAPSRHPLCSCRRDVGYGVTLSCTAVVVAWARSTRHRDAEYF